jgi:hypothetical protein
VLIGSGLFIWYRERQLSRAERDEATAQTGSA